MTNEKRQGDISLLDHPVAQSLLRSTVPARFAYSWTDGTPRVVPIWFHWDGHEIVLGTPANAPKLKALTETKVALTIDTNDTPRNNVLLVRGTARVTVMDRIVPEYALMARRYRGERAEGWLRQLEGMLPAMGGMARIGITPEWVAILDFQECLPSAIERAMAKAKVT